MRAAFYKGNRPGLSGIYNRVIRFWDHGPYSHVELQFSDSLSASSSLEDGGVRFKAIDFDAERWDFVDLPDSLALPAMGWFQVHAGQGYDLMGNFRFVLPPLSDSKSRWFCSEAVAAALGIPDPWRYGPNALASTLSIFSQPASAGPTLSQQQESDAWTPNRSSTSSSA